MAEDDIDEDEVDDTSTGEDADYSAAEDDDDDFEGP